MSGKKRIAVLISGSGSNLQALIDLCAGQTFAGEIALVISNKSDAYGLERASKAGIENLAISHKDYADRDAFDAKLQETLQEHKIEIVCLAGFMRIFTPQFVNNWEGRMLNVHPSLLPLFTGLNTHQRAIDAGARFTGCTVHFVTAELDGGPIIIQAAVPISPTDSADDLATKVLPFEHQIYQKALRWLVDGTVEMLDGKTILNGKIENSDGAISPQLA